MSYGKSYTVLSIESAKNLLLKSPDMLEEPFLTELLQSVWNLGYYAGKKAQREALREKLGLEEN